MWLRTLWRQVWETRNKKKIGKKDNKNNIWPNITNKVDTKENKRRDW